jgi:hypothetical protein
MLTYSCAPYIHRFEERQAQKPPASATRVEPSACLPSTSTEQDNQRNTETVAGEEKDELPELPSYFSGKTFLLYGKVTDRRTVLRYIVAYDGWVKVISQFDLTLHRFQIYVRNAKKFRCFASFSYLGKWWIFRVEILSDIRLLLKRFQKSFLI